MFAEKLGRHLVGSWHHALSDVNAKLLRCRTDGRAKGPAKAHVLHMPQPAPTVLHKAEDTLRIASSFSGSSSEKSPKMSFSSSVAPWLHEAYCTRQLAGDCL